MSAENQLVSHSDAILCVLCVTSLISVSDNHYHSHLVQIADVLNNIALPASAFAPFKSAHFLFKFVLIPLVRAAVESTTLTNSHWMGSGSVAMRG